MKNGKKLSKRKHLAFLARYGPIGHLIQLEIKLMWRNKRTRQILFMSLVFVLLGFFYSLSSVYEGNTSIFMASFGFLLLSGGLVQNYGPLMFSWESRYFDGTLVRPIDFRAMVRAKLLFLQASCLVLFCFSGIGRLGPRRRPSHAGSPAPAASTGGHAIDTAI